MYKEGLAQHEEHAMQFLHLAVIYPCP